jgi:3-oxoacyl-[acyl-carrier-protein] synthase II
MTRHRERRAFLLGFDWSARTSAGDDWPGSWWALVQGRRRFESPKRSIASWPDDAPAACLESWPHGLKLSGRATTLARVLGRDAGPVCEELQRANPGLRLTVLVASSHGETYSVSEFAEYFTGKAPAPGPSASETILCDGLLPAFLDGLGTAWPAATISAACASACVATGLAAGRIRAGACDACVVVSLDVLSRVAHAGFQQIGAMSSGGCRPFDRGRDGTTIGEAGAVALLVGEGVEPPVSRRWMVEVLGFGQSCDARHPVEPSAEGIAQSLDRALAGAGRAPSSLAAVYWHGTGTVQNDRAEAEAARRVFGADAPAGTSTKGVFGHAMGASAALSILAAAETITTRLLPPVAGLEEPEFPHLNLSAGRPAEVGDGPVAVVSLGFGGINAALLLGAC